MKQRNMKPIKQMLAVVLTVVLVLSMGVTALAATDGLYTYTVENNKATITKVSTDATGAITVPATLGGAPVTAIGVNAFKSCNKITSVTLPDTVTEIGENAFRFCRNMTSVNLPEGMTEIAYGVFEECDSLFSVTVPESVTAIGENAFYSCNKLANVTLKEGITTIGSYAFYDNDALTSIKLPVSLTSLGMGAFTNCDKLGSIALPEALTEIGVSCFEDCTTLRTVSFNRNLVSIGSNAFKNCTALQSATIYQGVTYMGQLVFMNCSSLKKVVLPEGLTKIDWLTFVDCVALEELTIPVSMETIERGATQGCTALTTIHYAGTAQDWAVIDIDHMGNDPLLDAVSDEAGPLDMQFRACDQTSMDWNSAGSNIAGGDFGASVSTVLNIEGNGCMEAKWEQSTTRVNQYVYAYGQMLNTNATLDGYNTATVREGTTALYVAFDLYVNHASQLKSASSAGIGVDTVATGGANAWGNFATGSFTSSLANLKDGWNHLYVKISPKTADALKEGTVHQFAGMHIYFDGVSVQSGFHLALDDIRIMDQNALTTTYVKRNAAKDLTLAIRNVTDATSYDDQKAIVEQYNAMERAYQKVVLDYDEFSYSFAEKFASQLVVEMIDALPATITVEDEAAITEARAAYDDLTEEQKKAVTNYEKLTAAEEALAKLKGMPGDLNGDKVVDAKDALAALKHAVGKPTLSDDLVKLGDLNGDGILDAKDALAMLKIAVGK